MCVNAEANVAAAVGLLLTVTFAVLCAWALHAAANPTGPCTVEVVERSGSVHEFTGTRQQGRCRIYLNGKGQQ